MSYIIRKGKKWMTGHSYATGLGDSYSWSFRAEQARRFPPHNRHTADSLANSSGGRVEQVPSTRKELLAYAKFLTANRKRTDLSKCLSNEGMIERRVTLYDVRLWQAGDASTVRSLLKIDYYRAPMPCLPS